MAHRRSFRGRGISDAQRRKKSWIQINSVAVTNGSTGDLTIGLKFSAPTGAVLTSPQSQTVGFFSDEGEIPEESTILRIRGSLNISKNSYSVGSIDAFAFGIGVLERNAAELGVVPDPSTPKGGAWDGWMFVRSINSSIVDANATIVDVKSMRKLQGGYALILVVGATRSTIPAGDPASAPPIEAEFTGRALILLP